MGYCSLADTEELHCLGYNLGMGMDFIKLLPILYE